MSDDDDMMRHWTTDAFGNRVLRGLTSSETEELERLREAERDGQDIDVGRYLELNRRHEVARIQAVSAEVQARQEPKQ